MGCFAQTRTIFLKIVELSSFIHTTFIIELKRELSQESWANFTRRDVNEEARVLLRTEKEQGPVPDGRPLSAADLLLGLPAHVRLGPGL